MLAKRLKELRESAGLTQLSLARNLYMHEATYRAYEKGDRYPSVTVLEQIAKFYDCSMDYLRGLSDIRTTKPDAKDKIIRDLTAENNELKKQIKEIIVALSKVVDISLTPSGRYRA